MKRHNFILLLQPARGGFFLLLPVVLCTGLNLLFSLLNNAVLRSPLFLDSIFTAAAGALYGPWTGLATGLVTNLAMEPVYGMTGFYWPFAVCNMATGLIVGLAVRRRLFSSGYQVTLIILGVTLANSLLGALVSQLIYRGDTGVPVDYIVSAFTEMGQSLISASFWARIPTNLVDKMISVYAAYALHLLAVRDRESWKPSDPRLS